MQSFRQTWLCIAAWILVSGGLAQSPSIYHPTPGAVELRGELEASAAEILRLRQEIVRLHAAISDSLLPAAVVTPASERLFHFGGFRKVTPTSSLTREHAQQIGRLFSVLRPGTSYAMVLPTGSMKPLFDEKAVLLTESAPFNDLKVGDLVTYRHPGLDQPVVHRLVQHDGNRFWAKGDANEHVDDVYITRANYLRRVYGMIYSKE